MANTTPAQESGHLWTEQFSPPSHVDAEVLEKVRALLSHSSDDLKSTLVRDMLSDVLKLHDTPVDLLDIKILSRAFKELRYGFGVFHPYSHCLKVSIFGSACVPVRSADESTWVHGDYRRW